MSDEPYWCNTCKCMHGYNETCPSRETGSSFAAPAGSASPDAAREIHDMIQTCDLLPGEDTTGRLLDICLALNQRINSLELELHKRTNEGAQGGSGTATPF